MNRERSKTVMGGQFLQQVEDILITGYDGRTIPHVTCFKFQRKEHYSDHCPDDSGEGGRVELMEEILNNYRLVARLRMRISSKKLRNLLMLKR